VKRFRFGKGYVMAQNALIKKGQSNMSLHAQRKGKAGEEEFCKWLYDNFGIEVARNLKQSKGKGSDIVVNDFMFEIKRREVLDLDSWWRQVCVAAKQYKHEGLIPVVAFRQNRKPWQFLIPAKLIPGVTRGYVIANERIIKELIAGIL
jgi:Holliday junction resolvase